MLFKTLKLLNFMQYKGEIVIEFSCDTNKNITVILGDNTCGKTTVAQSIRWLLYGVLEAPTNSDNEKLEILNYDILSELKFGEIANIIVELTIIYDFKEYTIKRSAELKRKVPNLESIFIKSEKSILYKDIKQGSSGATVPISPSKFDETISTLLPKDLSQYFLFNGERWNNDSVPQAKKVNIKESVQKLLGLSALKQAMYHLKEMGNGRSSVIGKFKSKLVGKGTEFEDTRREIDKRASEMDAIDKVLDNLKQKITFHEGEKEKYKEEITANAQIVAFQQMSNQLEKDIRTYEEMIDKAYQNFISIFSDYGYSFFAMPMLEEARNVLKEAKVENKGIPHMNARSIDFLINRRQCICGAEIKPDSVELANLEREKNFLPPLSLGTVLRTFESIIKQWENRANELSRRMDDVAENHENLVEKIDEKRVEIDKLSGKVDRSIDINYYKQKLQDAEKHLKAYYSETGENNNKKERLKNEIESLEKRQQELQAKSEANLIIHERIRYAEYLYNYFKDTYERNEHDLLDKLNERIKFHFQRMFNVQNKYAGIDDDYNIKLFLQDYSGVVEAYGLSEGEKVARNFAFIVSIIEYAKEHRETEELKPEPLPLVLDAPFSRLGAENIGLVSKVLPAIAEQVIVLMLEKDWEHVKQDDKVGCEYRLSKEANCNYTQIRRCK